MAKKLSIPQKKGSLDIYAQVTDARYIGVVIIGDPAGLKYLADLLIDLAEYDQNENSDPVGEREHIHLHVSEQLGDFSCEVELCRADAKGTRELPDFMI